MKNRNLRNDYYIYALIDPRDKKYFYIGYGVKNRMYEHWRIFLNNPLKETNIFKKKKFQSLLNSGWIPDVFKLKENLSHRLALKYEKIYIRKFGTKYDKTGYLCNLSKGGDGGCFPNNKNAGNDKELYKKLMVYIEKNVRGKKITDVNHINAMRESALKREIHGMTGKNHSVESRKIIAKKSVGNKNAKVIWSEERIIKLRNSISKRNNRLDTRIIAYKLNKKQYYIFKTSKQSKQYLSIPLVANISSVLNGNEKTKYGYCFKYFDQVLIDELKSKNYEECKNKKYKEIGN